MPTYEPAPSLKSQLQAWYGLVSESKSQQALDLLASYETKFPGHPDILARKAYPLALLGKQREVGDVLNALMETPYAGTPDALYLVRFGAMRFPQLIPKYSQLVSVWFQRDPKDFNLTRSYICEELRPYNYLNVQKASMSAFIKFKQPNFYFWSIAAASFRFLQILAIPPIEQGKLASVAYKDVAQLFKLLSAMYKRLAQTPQTIPIASSIQFFYTIPRQYLIELMLHHWNIAPTECEQLTSSHHIFDGSVPLLEQLSSISSTITAATSNRPPIALSSTLHAIPRASHLCHVGIASTCLRAATSTTTPVIAQRLPYPAVESQPVLLQSALEQLKTAPLGPVLEQRNKTHHTMIRFTLFTLQLHALATAPAQNVSEGDEKGSQSDLVVSLLNSLRTILRRDLCSFPDDWSFLSLHLGLQVINRLGAWRQLPSIALLPSPTDQLVPADFNSPYTPGIFHFHPYSAILNPQFDSSSATPLIVTLAHAVHSQPDIFPPTHSLSRLVTPVSASDSFSDAAIGLQPAQGFNPVLSPSARPAVQSLNVSYIVQQLVALKSDLGHLWTAANKSATAPAGALGKDFPNPQTLGYTCRGPILAYLEADRLVLAMFLHLIASSDPKWAAWLVSSAQQLYQQAKTMSLDTVSTVPFDMLLASMPPPSSSSEQQDLNTAVLTTLLLLLSHYISDLCAYITMYINSQSLLSDISFYINALAGFSHTYPILSTPQVQFMIRIADPSHPQLLSLLAGSTGTAAAAAAAPEPTDSSHHPLTTLVSVTAGACIRPILQQHATKSRQLLDEWEFASAVISHIQHSLGKSSPARSQSLQLHPTAATTLAWPALLTAFTNGICFAINTQWLLRDETDRLTILYRMDVLASQKPSSSNTAPNKNKKNKQSGGNAKNNNNNNAKKDPIDALVLSTQQKHALDLILEPALDKISDELTNPELVTFPFLHFPPPSTPSSSKLSASLPPRHPQTPSDEEQPSTILHSRNVFAYHNSLSLAFILYQIIPAHGDSFIHTTTTTTATSSTTSSFPIVVGPSSPSISHTMILQQLYITAVQLVWIAVNHSRITFDKRRAYAQQLSVYNSVLNHLEFPAPVDPPADESPMSLLTLAIYFFIHIMHGLTQFQQQQSATTGSATFSHLPHSVPMLPSAQTIFTTCLSLFEWAHRVYPYEIQSRLLFAHFSTTFQQSFSPIQLWRFFIQMDIKQVQWDTLSNLYPAFTSLSPYSGLITALISRNVVHFHSNFISNNWDNFDQAFREERLDASDGLVSLTHRLSQSYAHCSAQINLALQESLGVYPTFVNNNGRVIATRVEKANNIQEVDGETKNGQSTTSSTKPSTIKATKEPSQRDAEKSKSLIDMDNVTKQQIPAYIRLLEHNGVQNTDFFDHFIDNASSVLLHHFNNMFIKFSSQAACTMPTYYMSSNQQQQQQHRQDVPTNLSELLHFVANRHNNYDLSVFRPPSVVPTITARVLGAPAQGVVPFCSAPSSSSSSLVSRSDMDCNLTYLSSFVHTPFPKHYYNTAASSSSLSSTQALLRDSTTSAALVNEYYCTSHQQNIALQTKTALVVQMFVLSRCFSQQQQQQQQRDHKFHQQTIYIDEDNGDNENDTFDQDDSAVWFQHCQAQPNIILSEANRIYLDNIFDFVVDLYSMDTTITQLVDTAPFSSLCSDQINQAIVSILDAVRKARHGSISPSAEIDATLLLQSAALFHALTTFYSTFSSDSDKEQLAQSVQQSIVPIVDTCIDQITSLLNWIVSIDKQCARIVSSHDDITQLPQMPVLSQQFIESFLTYIIQPLSLILAIVQKYTPVSSDSSLPTAAKILNLFSDLIQNGILSVQIEYHNAVSTCLVPSPFSAYLTLLQRQEPTLCLETRDLEESLIHKQLANHDNQPDDEDVPESQTISLGSLASIISQVPSQVQREQYTLVQNNAIDTFFNAIITMTQLTHITAGFIRQYSQTAATMPQQNVQFIQYLSSQLHNSSQTITKLVNMVQTRPMAQPLDVEDAHLIFARYLEDQNVLTDMIQSVVSDHDEQI